MPGVHTKSRPAKGRLPAAVPPNLAYRLAPVVMTGPVVVRSIWSRNVGRRSSLPAQPVRQARSVDGSEGMSNLVDEWVLSGSHSLSSSSLRTTRPRHCVINTVIVTIVANPATPLNGSAVGFPLLCGTRVRMLSWIPVQFWARVSYYVLRGFFCVWTAQDVCMGTRTDSDRRPPARDARARMPSVDNAR